MITQQFSDPLYLRESRPESPRGTLLYLHGLGESCLAFEDLLEAEALRSYHQLAPDLLGFGKSPWPLSPQGLNDQADCIGQWLESTFQPAQTSPVVVVGHSMGGVLGLLLSERFPHLVRGLVNIEGNISEADCTFSGRIAGFSQGEFEQTGYAEVLNEVYREGLEDPPLQTYYASMRICDPKTLHRCATELLAVSQREVLAQRLAALNIPQVYILGDPRGTGTHSRALLDAASIPWHAISDAGHWVFLDQPEIFAELLVGELEKMIPE